MTQDLLHLGVDPTSCTTMVTALNSKGMVLDRTALYPLSDNKTGQPGYAGYAGDRVERVPGSAT